MSTSWFTTDSFFGIFIPMHCVKFVRKNLRRSRLEYKVIDVYLIECCWSNRGRHDFDFSNRFKGFLGFVWQSSLVEDILEMESMMRGFLSDHEDILKECGIIEPALCWTLGIYRDVTFYWDQLSDKDS